MSELYATVKWTDWEDDGRVTPCVLIEWIRNFNINRYDLDEKRKKRNYVINWKNGIKGNYPGCIIRISETPSVLERKVKDNDRDVSLRRIHKVEMCKRERSKKSDPKQEKKVKKGPFIKAGLKWLHEHVPDDILLKSSLEGMTKEGKTYEPLDPKVLSQLYESVKKAFRTTYDEDEMKNAITKHLDDFRKIF